MNSSRRTWCPFSNDNHFTDNVLERLVTISSSHGLLWSQILRGTRWFVTNMPIKHCLYKSIAWKLKRRSSTLVTKHLWSQKGSSTWRSSTLALWPVNPALSTVHFPEVVGSHRWMLLLQSPTIVSKLSHQQKFQICAWALHEDRLGPSLCRP